MKRAASSSPNSGPSDRGHLIIVDLHGGPSRTERDLANGMAVTVGRIRPDTVLDFKFVALSHNTVRGAAGGAVLTAELLAKKGYFS